MTKLCVLLLLSTTVCSAVPQQINYQGYLTRPNGTPLDTTVAITFRLYDVPAGGATFWTESRPSIPVQAGLFAVRLGEVTPLNDAMMPSPELWLGITVGNNSEMTPRQRVVSVAYAYRVGTISGASGGAVTGDVVIWGNGTISGDGTILGKGNIGTGNSNSGDHAFVAGWSCSASGDRSSVSGGQGNHAHGYCSAVNGGQWNDADSSYTAVGGGYHNQASGHGATVAGGWNNAATGDYSAVGGGGDPAADGGNTASGGYSTIAGGVSNDASAGWGTIAGGRDNTVSGQWGSIGGGTLNVASGSYATVPGGLRNNAAGLRSFAAGDSANALGRNSFTLGTRVSCAAESAFVWSDGSGPVLSIGSSKTFSVKASNGTRIWTNSNLTSGVTVGAGGNAWVGVSDSTKKRNIRGLDTQDILARFSSLPLKRWEYQSEEPGVEHIGPMAQDFWNAFHLGNEPLGISTIDADGVMMAAIQELAKQVSGLHAENAALQRQIQSLLAKDAQTQLEKEK